MIDLKKELTDLQISAYDKGFNDAITGIKEAFIALKVLPLKEIPIDKIIQMIDIAQVEGNKILTKYNV